jgi:hypothetical protein
MLLQCFSYGFRKLFVCVVDLGDLCVDEAEELLEFVLSYSCRKLARMLNIQELPTSHIKPKRDNDVHFSFRPPNRGLDFLF